ncbi:dehydrogenase [Vibrio vulnificus YJ016]|uniref:Dehydrogenase n=2 Tax=Vibrio vulnificus TaxID=672 RepID=Q7MBY8_VIBVY|nr:Chain A, Dehydrogenase [Vibrio vulnificus YJ016]3UCE_B Chain B, Dehydrogenase [Vibrio vulnificus YJ016]3UCE_C Chain C, Dehydrogenase [Vibrio vulnificus YJ016]3UCE_D Chain D, Dehydrogenase [Vibrio vulnificus YJ016]3UCF_A Chain A, Dehydrogenase [Vibrio vulnificus YJ016]3UCF_B Chain B, Dehydrogenase [Vibrio vulnificus YJ016]3UCF_C Chain C, Dehydrogenase [Vibrio vulnificus YJ016]3UCF_D Chain D, Dehydrogenase [Vibrio vulnificus YJ016]BAC97625.1 dehydrogenase [Vibrio vulnificus YJ016]
MMGSDKTVYVVLGGTSGIGAELAKQLESEHTIVHVASRQTGLDISDEKSVYHYFETIGAFDHLIVTAGSYAPAGKVVDVEVTQAKYAFDTKFWGAVLAAKHGARYLKQGGSITLTSGMLSRKVVANTYVKAAINAAIEATTKVLAKELAPIRVNAISPGLTKTEAYKGMNADDRDAMYQRTQSHLPVGKVGEASDIAMAYLFAIQNSYMTGTVIDVDGGALLG